MIKLAVVYPSCTKETHGEELLYSPLALGYLARHTPKHYKISLYDEYVGEDLDPNTVDADLVAFSAITPGIVRSYALADKLRKRGITCVGGGAHVSALPEEALAHYDAVVIGEGERPWQEFLNDFESGASKKTYFGPMNVPLDNLGTPRRDLIHPNYEYPSLLTSRGCPYACSFCYLTVYKKRKYRTIPHDTILEDLDSVKNSPILIITDENFMGYDKPDIEDRKILLEKMIRKNYKFFWGCQTTVNLHQQPELMSLMYRAGCRAVFLGFEAVGEDSLAEVNKQHNFGIDYNDVVKTLHDHNLGVIASCILGLDSHEKDYHKKLIKAIKESKADFPRVFFMTAWPGTPLYKSLAREGRACQDWGKVRKDMPSIQFKHYTHEEILQARDEIIVSFFNFFNVSTVVLRWLFKDRSILLIFLRMVFRSPIAEKVKQFRVRKLQKTL